MNTCNWDCHLCSLDDLKKTQNWIQWAETSVICACPICSLMYSLRLLLRKVSKWFLVKQKPLASPIIGSYLNQTVHSSTLHPQHFSLLKLWLLQGLFLLFTVTPMILSMLLYRKIMMSPSWKNWLLLNACRVVIFWG